MAVQQPTWSVHHVHEEGFAIAASQDEGHWCRLETDSPRLLIHSCVCETQWALIVAPLISQVVRLLHQHVHQLRNSNSPLL